MDKMRNKIFVGCLALLLVMVVGYALFNQNLSINGTATAKGDFDIEITNAIIKAEKGSTGATATISSDGKALTITVPRLEYPSSYVDVSYNIENKGSIAALFENYSITGETDTIKTEFSFENLYYDKKDKSTENIRIYWDKDSNVTEESATITLKMNFVQVGGKEKACEALKNTANCIYDWEVSYDTTLSCAQGIDDDFNLIPGANTYDFNHDGLLDITDAGDIENFAYNKLGCSYN